MFDWLISILKAGSIFPSRPVTFYGEKVSLLIKMQKNENFLRTIFIYGSAKKPDERRVWRTIEC